VAGFQNADHRGQGPRVWIGAGLDAALGRGAGAAAAAAEGGAPQGRGDHAAMPPPLARASTAAPSARGRCMGDGGSNASAQGVPAMLAAASAAVGARFTTLAASPPVRMALREKSAGISRVLWPRNPRCDNTRP